MNRANDIITDIVVLIIDNEKDKPYPVDVDIFLELLPLVVSKGMSSIIFSFSVFRVKKKGVIRGERSKQGCFNIIWATIPKCYNTKIITLLIIISLEIRRLR